MADERSWLNVVPDTQWLPTEVRERFTAPAEMLTNKDEKMQQTLLAIYAYPTIKHAIDLYERVRHWKFLEVVPKNRPLPEQACCARILRGKTGEALPLRFELSPFQGDVDDATNMGTAFDHDARLGEGLMDWVAVLHFLQPALLIDGRAMAIEEDRPGLDEGHMPFELLPAVLQTAIKEKRDRGRRI